MWLNAHTKTIHMSQHMSKERRHKEASLTDVISVVAGEPVKRRASDTCLKDTCLTINFRRGGGIDLQFTSQEQRDIWYDALCTVVRNN